MSIRPVLKRDREPEERRKSRCSFERYYSEKKNSMNDSKESDKNHIIEKVVTILAVSTMMFFLIVLSAYGHDSDSLSSLDANGGHRSEIEGYHTHRTPKQMIEFMKKTSREREKRLIELLEKNQGIKPSSNGGSSKVEEPPFDDEKQQRSEQISKFLDAGFGLGVGLLHGLGTKNVSATLDKNGIVTVVEDETRDIDLLLEAHYYPQQWRRLEGNFAHGPFVLLNTGAIDTDAEILRTLGIGWMMGVRVAGDKSINIGLAYALKHGVQSLRSNFVVGQKAPRDDMGNFIEPQYTKSTEGAWVILVSFAPF